MTTRVQVHANHGWPVDVTPIGPNGLPSDGKRRVPPGTSGEFLVYAGQDLLIHEVQPSELAAEIDVASSVIVAEEA